MVRKLAGKYHSGDIPHLEVNNNKITKIQEVSNEFAHTFSDNSCSHNYNSRFQSFRSEAETQHLRFKSNNNESYNNQFSVKELSDAISKAHDTAVRRLCKRFLGLSTTSGTLVIFPTAGVRLLSHLFQNLVKTNRTLPTIVLSL